MDYIFWGAGRIGKYAVDMWLEHNCNILYFVDSNSQMWGGAYAGIPICTPERIYNEIGEYQVIFTCKESSIPYNKLIQYGIPKERLVRWSEVDKVLPDIWDNKKGYIKADSAYRRNSVKRMVLFGLDNGLVLGGVEAWTFQTAKLLKRWGVESRYLVDGTRECHILQERENSIELMLSADNGMKRKLDLVVEAIQKKTPCNIICNFPRDFFRAGCYVKHMSPEEIRVIAVIHNDEELYYDTCSYMERYISYCLVISRSMEKRLLQKGFPKEKIRYLNWSIPVSDSLRHTYSVMGESLLLGYAGRVTITQKRMDLLWEVIEKLAEKRMEFVLEVAGIGNYLEVFSEQVKAAGLQDKVRFVGFLPRNKILSFWHRQDIMVSCSDWEGHSISQAEAMAAGAVPIVTEVSGARDDITNGENGFIVDIGAVDQIVEKICFLYEHRELLPVMGKKAYDAIKVRSEVVDLEEFWKSILI